MPPELEPPEPELPEPELPEPEFESPEPELPEPEFELSDPELLEPLSPPPKPTSRPCGVSIREPGPLMRTKAGHPQTERPLGHFHAQRRSNNFGVARIAIVANRIGNAGA